MSKFFVSMQVNKGKLNNTLEKLTAAIETIQKCYWELEEMGILVDCEDNEPPAATDGE